MLFHELSLEFVNRNNHFRNVNVLGSRVPLIFIEKRCDTDTYVGLPMLSTSLFWKHLGLAFVI